MLWWPILTVLAATSEDPAPGSGSAASVSWRAPPGCPGSEAVAGRVAALVGRVPAASELRVDGLVTAVDGGFLLTLRVEAAGVVDDRSLVADRCDALADATALVASVLVDPIVTATTIDVPSVVARVSASRPIGEVAVEGEPTGRDGTRDARAPRRSPESRARSGGGPIGVWTRIGGGGQLGAVPGLTGGFELALAVGVTRVRAELSGAWWLPRRVDAVDRTLRVQLGTVTARACATLPQGPLDVVACAGPEVGVMRGDVRGGVVRQPLWLAITALAGVRAPVSRRVSIWASAGVAAPVRFPRFRLVDAAGTSQREVYRPAAAGVRVQLGVEIRLRGLEAPRPARRRSRQ